MPELANKTWRNPAALPVCLLLDSAALICNGTARVRCNLRCLDFGRCSDITACGARRASSQLLRASATESE
jgi:hypothetical protein